MLDHSIIKICNISPNLAFKVTCTFLNSNPGQGTPASPNLTPPHQPSHANLCTEQLPSFPHNQQASGAGWGSTNCTSKRKVTKKKTFFQSKSSSESSEENTNIRKEVDDILNGNESEDETAEEASIIAEILNGRNITRKHYTSQ